MEVAANLLVKVGADIADAQKKLGTMGSTISDFGKSAMKAGGLMTAGLTLPIVALGAKAVGAASDLNESMSKVNVVFGESAAQITDWSTTAAASLGITQQQALESAGTFGNLFSAMGIGAQPTADMSKGLVQLAADLASFNNMDPTEVLDKLRAGVIGEAEPLRTLGVNLSAAATEAYILSNGLAATKEEITPAIKAQANYALILEQTTLAQGDYARTADGLANSQRTLSATVGDLTANIGTMLLPIAQELLKRVASLVTWFSNLDPKIMGIIVGVAGLAAAAGPLVTAFGAIVTVVGALLSPIGLVVAAVAGLAVLFATDFGGIRTAVMEAIQPVIDIFNRLAEVISWGIEDGWSVAEWIEVLSRKFPSIEPVIDMLSDLYDIAVNVADVIKTQLITVGETLAQLWTDKIAPALEVARAAIEDNLLPAFSTFAEWLGTIIPPIIEAVGGFLTEKLLPAFADVAAFVIGTVIPVIADIAAWLLTNIPVAIAAASDFFETKLMPALTTIWEFIEASVIPIFEDVVAWLAENIPVAIETVSKFWEETLQPALETVWEFIQENIIPIFEDVVAWLADNIPVALQTLADFWENILKPAIEKVWEFLNTYLIPLFVALVDVNIALLKLALEALALIWETVLKPALEKVWSFLADNVIPVFVELKAKLDGPVTTALNAITLIFDKVAGAIATIGQKVQDVIGWLQDLAGWIASIDLGALGGLLGLGGGKGAEGAGGIGESTALALAGDAKAIADALAALVNAFTAVAQYSGSKIGPQLNRLIDQLRGAIYKLTKLAEILKREGLDAAVVLSEAGGKIGRALTGLVDGFVAVAGYAPQVIGPQLNTLFSQLHGLIFKISKVAALFDQDGLDAAVVLAEAASKIIAMVSDALELFEKLRGYTTPGIEAINRFERDMQYALERWVRWVVLTLQPLAEGVSAEMADIIAATVGAMGEALEVLAGLVAYVSPAQQAIDDFVRDLGILFTAFYDWAVGSGGSEGSPGMLMDIPPELLAVFNDVMDGLGTAVDTLTALTDYVGPTSDAIGEFIGDMSALFTAFYEWAMGSGGSEGSPGMLMEIPPELLATFQAVMDGLGSAVDVLTGLVDYVGPSDGAITEFTSDYTQLFEGFATWAEGTFADATFEATAAVASVFGDVMDGLGSAVGTLTALVDYVGPSDASVTQFETDYQRLMTGFRQWAMTAWTVEVAAVVQAVGAAVGAVMSGLGAAVTTLVGIVGYVGPSESAINRFETDYQRLMTGFRQWAMTAWTVEVAAVVQAVGDAANSLFTGLGAAAALLVAIRSYTSPAQSAIDGFVADMQALMITFRDFATGSFTTDSLTILNTFATVAQNMFTAIGTALDTLSGIADYTTSGSDFDIALQLFNQNLDRAIQSWHDWIVDIMDPEAAALVAAFNGVLTDIVTGFRDALNLLMDIEAANLPTTDELAAFLDALDTLFNAVVSNFQQVSVDLQAAGYDIQATLYTIFNNINPDLWAAGLQTGAHFIGGLLQSMTSVSIITPLLNAMIDLANQLEDVLRAAWGISSPSKVAERIGGYFVTGLQKGLEDLADIPGMMNDALGMPMFGANVSIEPAPQRAYLTVSFEGAFQAGMSPRDEQRITSAMVNELRRQGVALATR